MTDRADEGAIDEAEESAASRPDHPGVSGAGDSGGDGAGQVELGPGVQSGGEGEGAADSEGAVDDEAESVDEATRLGASRRRHAGFAAGRAIVVLVVAAVVYEMVVPATHTDRSRLARLVPATSGLSVFAKTKPQAAAQNDAQTGLTDVTSAVKRSPDRTGIYSTAWSASETSAVGVIAFLLPDVATSQAVLPQIEGQQMGATTYAANSLDRKATGTLAGVPGSRTALYEPSAKAAKGTPSLAIALIRYGRVDSVSEAIGTASTIEAEAASLAKREHALLEQRGGQVSLTVTEYPVGATVGWAAGAVILAAIFALLPVLGRRRRERQRLAYEEEMANRVVVKGRIITKRRQ